MGLKLRHDGLILGVFSTLVSLVIIELLLRVALPILPAQVQDLTDNWPGGEPPRFVEYLDQRPFVKYIPNIKIRLPGFHVEEYIWEMDKMGFKNKKNLLDGPIFAIAIGDSFTEGHGVRVEDTYPSILTEKGLPTYNLGVSGYAATQSLGSVEMFGMALKPKWCIFTLNPGISSREEAYLDPDETKRLKAFTGGVSHHVWMQENPEIRHQHPLVLLALMRASFYTTRDRLAAMRRPKDDIATTFRQYEADFTHERNDTDATELAAHPLFQLLQKRVIETAQLCATNGAQTLLVNVSVRAPSYWRKATGKPLPAGNFTLVAGQLLSRLAKENGIHYLDLQPVMEAYMDKLDAAAPVEALPHLPRDGHYSRRGNEIVAAAIAAIIRP